MEGQQGKAVRRVTPPSRPETVLLSYSASARQHAGQLAGMLRDQGILCRLDEKLFDGADSVEPAVREAIAGADALCLVVSNRCPRTAWRAREAAVAAAAGRPVLVFVESLAIDWVHSTVPALLTHDPRRLALFFARSRPDPAGLWEFAKTFFVDRSSARRLLRKSPTAWQWLAATATAEDPASGELEIGFADESSAKAVEVRAVRAGVENGETVLHVGTADGKSYRLAYSNRIRAVVPAPVYPSAPVIGFMHADFDSGREWPRAGEPPVELRLLGRDVYGWHMSEFFWKAFVGSLPKMLGQPQPQ